MTTPLLKLLLCTRYLKLYGKLTGLTKLWHIRIGYVMDRAIIAFHQDEESHWVADLVCGHTQHVRHDPPLTYRPWVLSQEGRNQFLGTFLPCKKCDEAHSA